MYIFMHPILDLTIQICTLHFYYYCLFLLLLCYFMIEAVQISF